MGRSGKGEKEVGKVGRRRKLGQGGPEKVKRRSGRSVEEENEVRKVGKWSRRSGKGENEVGKVWRKRK